MRIIYRWEGQGPFMKLKNGWPKIRQKRSSGVEYNLLMLIMDPRE